MENNLIAKSGTSLAGRIADVWRFPFQKVHARMVVNHDFMYKHSLGIILGLECVGSFCIMMSGYSQGNEARMIAGGTGIVAAGLVAGFPEYKQDQSEIDRLHEMPLGALAITRMKHALQPWKYKQQSMAALFGYAGIEFMRAAWNPGEGYDPRMTDAVYGALMLMGSGHALFNPSEEEGMKGLSDTFKTFIFWNKINFNISMSEGDGWSMASVVPYDAQTAMTMVGASDKRQGVLSERA